ncbi:polysaccharide deacetylase family protein [Vibrio penaeicida]|uniref:polysaccharide deacetylase family protein n=1 Tax=Vibrio penaeicida TaxID=104609 RepID=UPI00191C8F16|nr:polysaccharide deacetylase family protein [Vibrio penaeicida]
MNRLTVAMYHYVRPIKTSRYPEIKGLELDLFVEQLEFFRDNYSIVTMEEVIEAQSQGTALPENALLLTFDDGYAEHFTYVYPLLKKYGVQGTFFIPAKAVLEHKVLDVNKVHYVLASVDNAQLLVDTLRNELENYSEEYQLDSFDNYFKEYAVANRFDTKEVIFVKRMLQHALPEELRNILADRLFRKYVGLSEEAFAKELYVTREQLELMVKDGMHVGCHGYDHYWWNRLDDETLELEIKRSTDFLKSLGCKMENWTACYPYGSYSEDVVALLESKGCKIAFTTEVRQVDVLNDHALLFARFDTNDFPPKSCNYLKYKG